MKTLLVLHAENFSLFQNTFLHFPSNLFSFYFTAFTSAINVVSIYLRNKKRGTLWIFREIRVSKLEWEGMTKAMMVAVVAININSDRGDFECYLFLRYVCTLYTGMRKTSWKTIVHDLSGGGQQQNFYFLPKEVLTMTIQV